MTSINAGGAFYRVQNSLNENSENIHFLKKTSSDTPFFAEFGWSSSDLAAIAGQKPVVNRARKSIATFKVRKGMPVGVSVTLRGARMYDFLSKLINIALPRIRDFRGLSTKSFDGRGNYSLGVKEQLIFPEINYEQVDAVRGMDISIVTTAPTDQEARAMLQALGLPFKRQNQQ